MKSTSALIAAASTAVVLLAGHGQAQAPTTPTPPAQRPSTAPAPAQRPSMPATGVSAAHTMEGEVTKVDAKKGWVDVKTPEGRMNSTIRPPRSRT